jgi:NAD(P)-dependent dehydrogenase (short-subunit alcohol dehydrogenase family)
MADNDGMKLAIVTGGTGALGRAVVSELAGSGWQVIAVDLKAPDEADRQAVVHKAVDLSDAEAVADLYAAIASEFGAIRALINVAGGFVWEPVDGGSLSSWDHMYAINLRTAVNSVRAALPHLADAGAAIVNVGAAAANSPGTGMAPYAASKAGVRALTESLAEELRPRGVRVNAVLPTILDTPTNRADMPDADTGTWVRPASAAKAIGFLVSDASAAITGAAIPLSFAV